MVGGLYTQILSGLHKGDALVLADVSEPVPTSGSASTFGEAALSGNTPTFGGSGPGGGGQAPRGLSTTGASGR